MGKTDMTSVAKVSACTCALVLTLYYMLSSGYAKTDKKVETPNAHLTEVKLEGLTFKMSFKNKDIKPGEKPEVIVDVVNTSDKKVERLVDLKILSTPEASPMSRMVLMPRDVWTKPIKISLGANQKETLTFNPGYTKKEKENLALSIRADGKTLVPDLAIGAVQPINLTALKKIQAKAK